MHHMLIAELISEGATAPAIAHTSEQTLVSWQWKFSHIPEAIKIDQKPYMIIRNLRVCRAFVDRD
jgi:hypothetical protein